MGLTSIATIVSIRATQALQASGADAESTSSAADAVANQFGGAIGLLNYGVLGILTLGFIRGWVVSPRERERLIADNVELKKESEKKDLEIARLNQVMQENLQAMVATTDKQIDLWSREQRGGRDRSGGPTS